MQPSFARQTALSFASGFLICLCFPKFNFSFLAWFAFLPLLWAVEGQSFKKSFFLGWLSGFTAFCGILYWLIPIFLAAHVSFWMGLVSLIFLSGFLALYYGTFSALWEWMRRRSPSGLIAIFFAASLWTSLEALRGWLFTGFPWAILGYSQWNHPQMIQIAEWAGVYGVSWMIVFFNLALYLGVREKKVPWVPSLILFALTASNLFLWRDGKKFIPDPGKKINVALLQGNINQYKKWNAEYVREILEAYGKLAQAAAAASPKPDLIVWPETAAPGWVPQDEKLIAWIQETVRQTGTYNIIGAVTKEGEKSFNSGFLFAPDGKEIGRYDKIHLVPFGEFVPFSPFLEKWVPVLNELGGFDGGIHGATLEFPKGKIGLNICYESIFPELIRRQAQAGAEFLANITNDGWYLETAAPEQHFSMNIFRAIENRRYLVRAANTGISGIIAPSGVPVRRTKLNERAWIAGEIYPSNQKTFYARFGNGFVWICAAFVGMMAALQILNRKKETRTT